MTSFAFIFGVVPLVWAIGAGAELRQTLGTAVFSGMIGVTVFGLIFTPVFYVISRWIAELRGAHRPRRAASATQRRGVVPPAQPPRYARRWPATRCRRIGGARRRHATML